MSSQRLRDLEHALSKVFSGDMSVEAGCVMDALTDLGWQLTPIAEAVVVTGVRRGHVLSNKPTITTASTSSLPKRRST